MKHIVILCIFLVSCGTMRQRGNIIRVDSNPRGLEVFDEDNQYLGNTPFAYKPFHLKKHYRFKFKDNKKYNYSCLNNIAGSFLPNLIPVLSYPVGTLISAASLATDYYTGHYVYCDEKVMYTSKTKSKKYKKRYLVLPPIFFDEKVSDRIRNIINKKYAKRSKFIDLSSSKKYLYLNGIDHRRNKNIEYLDHIYLDIIRKYKITHFIDTKIDESQSGSLVVKVIEVDAFDYAKKKTLGSFTYKSKSRKTVLEKISPYITFLPNSLTLSYSGNPRVTFSTQSASQDELRKIEKHPNAFPRAISAIGLDSVVHPQSLWSWDFHFNFSPSFGISSWRYLHNNDISDVEAFYGTMDGTLLFQTPVGQMAFGYGLGPMFIRENNSRYSDYRKSSFIQKIRIDYRYFWNQRWYSYISGSSFLVKSGTLNRPGYELTQWVRVFFGVGYYYPEYKIKLLSWL